MDDTAWFSFCDGDVQEVAPIANLEYLESLNAVLAVSENNVVTIFDANSGAILQECDDRSNAENGEQNLQCCYHKSTGNVAMSSGTSVGYRSHINGILLANNILQAPITSQLDIVTIELLISEARMLINFIQDTDLMSLPKKDGDDMKTKQDTTNIDSIEEILDVLVKQISNSDEADKVTPSGKWTTVKISLPYSTLKSACQTLLVGHQRYVQVLDKKALIPGYHQPRHSAYGLPIVSSMLHQLVLLYPADNPGCHGTSIHKPCRDLMYAELTRRATFSKWPHPDYKCALPYAMSEAGFYHQPAMQGDDRAMCFACHVCLVCWEPSDEPWSEHERHSPACPFVCCQPTVNVPLSVTHATQPALPNPFPTPEGSKVKPVIDFLSIGENSNLLAVASKSGMLATWDVSEVLPKLQSVSTVSKSNILYLLRHRLKQEKFPEAGRLVSANYVVSDLAITSLYVLDKVPPEPELATCDPQEYLTVPDGFNKGTGHKSSSGGEAAPEMLSLSKIPTFVVGATVQVHPRPFRGSAKVTSKQSPGVSLTESQKSGESSQPIKESSQVLESQSSFPEESAVKEAPSFQAFKFSVLLFLRPEKSRDEESAKSKSSKQHLTMSKTTLFVPKSSGIESFPISNNVGTMPIGKATQEYSDDELVMPDLMDFGPLTNEEMNQLVQDNMQDMQQNLFPKAEGMSDVDGNMMPLDPLDVFDSFGFEDIIDENTNVQVSDGEKSDKGKLTVATILQLVVIDHCKSGSEATSQPKRPLQIVNNILTTDNGQKLMVTTRPEGCATGPTQDTPIFDKPMKTLEDNVDKIQDTPSSEEKMQIEQSGSSAEMPSLEEQTRSLSGDPIFDSPTSIDSMHGAAPITTQQQQKDDALNTSQGQESIASLDDTQSARIPETEQPITVKFMSTPISDLSIRALESVENDVETMDTGEKVLDQTKRSALSNPGKFLVFDVEPAHSVYCVSPKEMTTADEGARWIKTTPILQIANFIFDFSHAPFEDEEGESVDGDDDEQEMKENNEEERVGRNDYDSSPKGLHALALTDKGEITILDIGKMKFVFKTEPSQVFTGKGADVTNGNNIGQTEKDESTDEESQGSGNERFTAFAYCPGAERVCVSTNAGKLAFIKIGKQTLASIDSQKSVLKSISDTAASTSTADQDQGSGARTASGKLKLTSAQLFVNQPLTIENLKNLVGLTKSEPLKPRFTATAPVCWREVPLDQGTPTRNIPQTLPQRDKIVIHRKIGTSQPASSVGKQQLQGRRHLRHPNEHFPDHAVSYTRAWRLQPDCLSWREHFFELVLPRSTSMSHIDLKFVLTSKLKPDHDIQITLLKHPGLSTSKREVLQSARKKWRHHAAKPAPPPLPANKAEKAPVSETIFPQVMHLLTEGFVDTLMELDIDNPVLLVVEEIEAEESVKKLVLMDGSKQTIVAICKNTPPELTVGHLVVLKGYMRVKVGLMNMQVIVSSLKSFTVAEIVSMNVDEIKSVDEDWSDLPYNTDWQGTRSKKIKEKTLENIEAAEKQSGDPIVAETTPVEKDKPTELEQETLLTVEPETEELEDELDGLSLDRSSILFGPVNLSDYVDASGIGGIVTIASRWLIKESRHRAVLLHIEAANSASTTGSKKFVGMQSDEWRKKGCNSLQEISVVINKAHRLNIPHERVQRFSLMCSRSLHTKLLAGICDQDNATPSSGKKFIAKSLPEKTAALDILNWVAALEVTDPNERNQLGGGKKKNTTNTVAATRALTPAQTLAWLVCFSDGKVKKSSKSDKKVKKSDENVAKATESIETSEKITSKSTAEEKVKKISKSGKVLPQGGAKYSLKKFLETCFLNSGRDISVRALRLIFNTVLSVDVYDHSTKVSGTRALCDAVIECLQMALERKVESAYGLYCLFQTLGVVMASEVQIGRRQSLEFMTLVQKCVSALSMASTLMKENIHPLHSFLRAKYGLYGTPFDPDRFTIEFTVAGSKNILPSCGTIPTNVTENVAKQQEWIKYFSDEELNIQDLVTPKVMNVRRGLAVGDFLDGLSIFRFGLVECQRLHFTCVDTSEGCTVGIDSDIDSEGIIANAPHADLPTPDINIFHDAKTGSAIMPPKNKMDFAKIMGKLHKESKETKDNIKETFTKIVDLSEEFGPDHFQDILKYYSISTETKEGESSTLPQVGKSYVKEFQQETAPKRSLPTFMDTSESIPPEADDQTKNPPENKVPLNIAFSNLSFALPPSTILTVSRMHSGARRRVVLDFGQIVELTDINIPSCPDLSSLVIDAWSEGTKDIRVKVGKHVVTHVGVSLDICDHDFVLCNLFPPVVCRYLLITAIGRYGTTNAQTSVNLGRFYGRPACVGHRKGHFAQDSQHVVPPPPKKSMKDPEHEGKDYNEERPVLVDTLDICCTAEGKLAAQRSLAYLRSYQDDTDCRYNLSCNELKSLLASSDSRQSSQLWLLGEFSLDHQGLFANSKKASLEKLLLAYKKCSRLQVQRKRVSHAIRYMESLLGITHNTPTFGSRPFFEPECQLLPSYNQLQTYCELMLNTLLSLPHGIYYAPQNDPKSLELPLCKEALINSHQCAQFFQNLICNGSPRLRVQTTCLLLSYSSPFPWWGDFLCQTLELTFAGAYQQPQYLPQEHLFTTLLALGQRCLAVPQKAENVVRSLLNLLQRLLSSAQDGARPETVASATATLDLNLLTWVLLYMSHLTETVMTQNESFMSDATPQAPSLSEPTTVTKKRPATTSNSATSTSGTVDVAEHLPYIPMSMMPPPPPSMIMMPGGSATPPTMYGMSSYGPWMKFPLQGLPISGSSASVPGTSSPKSTKPGTSGSKPPMNTKETRFKNRWNFVSVSGEEGSKSTAECSGYMKILNWMQAINTKLKYHRSELLGLFKEKCALLKKAKNLDAGKEEDFKALQNMIKKIVLKSGEHYRNIIGYRRSLDRKNVYGQLQRVKPPDVIGKVSDALPTPTSFVNVPVEACRAVIRNIFSILLRLDLTVPSDFVVLACKVSSQLSRWCSAQCIHVAGQESPVGGSKKIMPPLFLSELLDYDDMKKFIILSVGGAQTAKAGRKNIPEPQMGHPAGPWVNHALVSLLQDVIESENTAMASCETELYPSSCTDWINAMSMDYMPEDPPTTSKVEDNEQTPEEAENSTESPEEISETAAEKNMKNKEYSQRMELVDNFIKLSEEFLTDIKMFMKARGEDPDSAGTSKQFADPSTSQTEGPAGGPTTKSQLYHQLRSLLSDGSPQSPELPKSSSDLGTPEGQTTTHPMSAFLQNIRLTENGGHKLTISGANRQFLCSHIYDTRSVHGVSQHVELTLKLCMMGHLKLLSRSFSHPPTAFVEETARTDEKMDADSANLPKPLGSFLMLQKCIQEILQESTAHAVPLTSLCELILLLQEIYKESLNDTLDIKNGQSLALLADDGTKALLAAVDFARGSQSNALVWSMALDLLATYMDENTRAILLVDNLQKLLSSDFRLANFMVNMLSRELAGSNIGTGHFNKGTSLLGPPICTQLKKLLDGFQRTAKIAVDVFGRIGRMSFPNLYIDLRDFLIFVVDILCEKAVFGHTSNTPTDGQIILVDALLNIMAICRNRAELRIWTKEPTWILGIFRTVSNYAYLYLNWSERAVKSDSERGIDPCSCMKGLFSAVLPQSYSASNALMKIDSPRDTLMLKLLQLCLELTWIVCPINRPSTVEKSPSSDQMETAEEQTEQEPMEFEAEVPEMDVDSGKKAEETKKVIFINFGDILLTKDGIVQKLLATLALCTGFVMASVLSSLDITPALAIERSAASTGDGVFILLSGIFESARYESLPVNAILSYLAGSALVEGKYVSQSTLPATTQLSQPLLWLILSVFEKSWSVNQFLSLGGARLITDSLVAAAKESLDQTQGRTSKMLQFLTAASNRATAFAPKPPVVLHNEGNWPPLGNGKTMQKITAGGQGFNYPPLQGNIAGPGPVMSVKELTAPLSQSKEFDFAAVATIECSDFSAPPADSLLKPKAVHRRSRTPLWSYHFPAEKHWVSLTLHFPTAFVLRKVKIQPMMMSLSTEPSAILLEVNRTGSPSTSAYQPVSVPMVASGMGDIVIEPPSDEIVSSIRIHMKRPLDSSSIGLTRIVVIGISSFMSYDPSASPSKSSGKFHSKSFETLNMMMADEKRNRKSTINWLRLLHHCLTFEDGKFAPMFHDVIIDAEGLIPTLCALLEHPVQSIYISTIEKVLLQTAIPEKVSELIGCILKGSKDACSSHFLGGFSQTSSESTINLIIALCQTENEQHLELRLKEMMKWIIECAYVGADSSGFGNTKANASHVHAIACCFWKCAEKISARNCIDFEKTKIVFDWGQLLGTKKTSSLSSNHFSAPLKNSIDWLLCAFCSVNIENYNYILNWMGLANTQASSVSLSNCQINTLAAVSQTKECIKILGAQGIVQLFSNGLQQFCHNLLEAYQIPQESNDNLKDEAALEVTTSNVIVVIEFFSVLSNLSLVQVWLGTEGGAKTWHVLLKTLYHVMIVTNKQYLSGPSLPILPRRLLLDLQESTTAFLKQVTKCNEHNQQLFTRALCDIVSCQLDKSPRVTQLSGFIRSLLLRIVLEDEQYTVSMVAATKQNLHKGKSNSSVSGGSTLRHPAFGTGHLSRTFEVGVSSTLKQVWKLASDTSLSSDKQQKSKAQVGQRKASETLVEVDAQKPTGASVAYTPSPPSMTTSYASVVKPPKPAFQTTSSGASAEELIDMLVSGKNAQEKRNPKSTSASDFDTGGKSVSNVSPLIKLKCPELGDEDLTKEVTLLQLLAKYKERNVQPFWKSISLEFHATLKKISLDGTRDSEDDTIMEMSVSDTSTNISQPSKAMEEKVQEEPATNDETEDESKKRLRPLKTILEVFAGLGGLALVAERLPTVTLDIGQAPTSSIGEANPTEPMQFAQPSEPYLNWGTTVPGTGTWVEDDDWFGFEDDDYYVPASYNGMPKMEQKAPMKLPQPPSVVGSSTANPCVPAHTMSALCLFLRVPHFSEEFLLRQKSARCLLRLMLGVQDDGQGEQILKLGLAQSLPMLPFAAICSLLSRYGPTSESGLAIREAMTFETTSIHLVLACLSSFTHNEPNENAPAGRLLASLLPYQESTPIRVAPPSYKGPNQPPTAASKRVNFANKQGEKNYWAKGTGFGTGSTTSDWDVGNAVKKQKKEEEFITVLLEVLANFVCPGCEPKDGENDQGEETARKSLPMDGRFATAVPEILTASGLIPAIASYLRNDSVLDMAHHVPLYCSLLSVIRSFAVCPVLCRLLMDSTMTTKQSEDGGSTSSNTDSILSLLSKMRKCIDTYASRLKATNTSLENQGEEGLTTFVLNVQKTEGMLSKIAKEMKSRDSEKANDSSSSGKSSSSDNSLTRMTLSSVSLEKRYVDEMRTLQFDTAELVVEDDEGGLKFPSGHNYSTHIKEAANVSDAARARRLAQETVTLSNSLPLSHSSTVFVRCDEERLDVMKVLITGPSETPYANGCFEFDIFFPTEYNHSPPLVNLQTTGNHSIRFNPNLYNDGKVCLSILNTWHGRPEEKWDPHTSSFLQILVSIQSLILVSEPYFNEPGYERSRGTPAGEQSSREYDANIQQATVRWAMLEQLRNPSPCFKDVIDYHFWLKKDEILAQCSKWTAEMTKPMNERPGRRTLAHNYTALSRHTELLKQELVKMKCPEGLEDTQIKVDSSMMTEYNPQAEATAQDSDPSGITNNIEKPTSK